MSMYLPNPDLQPTGSEMTEFLDVPPMADTPTGPFPRVAPGTTGPSAVEPSDPIAMSADTMSADTMSADQGAPADTGGAEPWEAGGGRPVH